jgi:RNA polymerase sigma factor (sigma-70 family)
MRRREVILRSRLLPSNQDISKALVERYRTLIHGTSVKMATRYSFSREDREDLVSFATLQVYSVDWRKKIRQNRTWIEKNHRRPQPWKPWEMEEVFKVVGGYAVSFIRNWMRRGVRSNLANGLSGLDWRHRLDEFPFHNDDDEVEVAVDDIETKAAAHQMAEIAEKVLNPVEWKLVRLQFGLDTGESKTPEQVARLVGMPREQVRQVLEAAMEKLRQHVGLQEVDGAEPGN